MRAITGVFYDKKPRVTQMPVMYPGPHTLHYMVVTTKCLHTVSPSTSCTYNIHDTQYILMCNTE